MKYRVVIERPAWQDIDEAYEWLYQRVPEHAVRSDALGRRSLDRGLGQTIEKASRDGDGRRFEKAAGLRVRGEELGDAIGELFVRA